MSRTDPSTNTVTLTVEVGDGPINMAFDGTILWVANGESGTVSKIVPV